MSYQDTLSPLAIEYIESDDIVLICGVKYAGEVFRSMCLAEPGTWLRIGSRSEDGAITVKSVPESVERTFDAIVGKGRA